MQQTKHMPTEADVGSGEKSPGQHDTEKFIEQVFQRPAPGQKGQEREQASPHHHKGTAPSDRDK